MIGVIARTLTRSKPTVQSVGKTNGSFSGSIVLHLRSRYAHIGIAEGDLFRGRDANTARLPSFPLTASAAPQRDWIDCIGQDYCRYGICYVLYRYVILCDGVGTCPVSVDGHYRDSREAPWAEPRGCLQGPLLAMMEPRPPAVPSLCPSPVFESPIFANGRSAVGLCE